MFIQLIITAVVTRITAWNILHNTFPFCLTFLLITLFFNCPQEASYPICPKKRKSMQGLNSATLFLQFYVQHEGQASTAILLLSYARNYKEEIRCLAESMRPDIMSSNKYYKISVLDPIFVLDLVRLNRCQFLTPGKKEWQIAPGRTKSMNIYMVRRPDQTAKPCTIRYLNIPHPVPSDHVGYTQ